MIHKALLGSIERFLSVYIEHTAGNFPLWLAPEQVWVLPIGEAHQSRASEITQALREAGLRAHLHAEDESLGKRIRSAKLQKIPYMVIMGDKEVESQTITLESRDRGNLGSMDIETALTDLLREQSTKSLN
jgi:threonyl-tRNA synthetase